MVRRVKFVHPLKVRRFFGFQDRFSASNPTSPKARRAVFWPARPLLVPCPPKACLAASACCCSPFSARCWLALSLINRFLLSLHTTNVSGLSWPSINHARHVPRFVQLSGRRPAGNAFLPWLLILVVLLPCVALLPVLALVVVPPCAACRASKTVMAVGHPFIGRGSRPKVGGTPKGCPGRRPQER